MITISAATRAALAKPKVEVLKQLYIVGELLNSDARTFTDVSKYVRQHGRLGGASTIKEDQWEIPSFAPMLANGDNYFTENHPDSVWTAISQDPKDCWVMLLVLVNAQVIRQYFGKIKECEVQNEEDVDHVILRTVMGADEGLAAGIDKHSGDEQIVAYNDW